MRSDVLRILLLASLFTSFSAGACPNRVDPKKVVVFVDTNGSFLEFQEAKKAACARGESFMVLPHGEEHSKKVGQAYYDYQAARKKSNRAGCGRNDTPECVRLDKAVEQSEIRFYQMKDSKPPMDKNILQRELKKLADKNAAVTALALSGHDGGGSIHGNLGGVNKHEVTAALSTAYKGKEGLIGQLETVLLWGCYTTKPSEVFFWKNALPGLKVLGGFHEIGPSNDKEASRDLMRDLLVKSKRISETKNVRQLESMINQLEDIHYTSAGMYVNAQCEEGDDWYYRHNPYETDSKKRREFLKLNNLASCHELRYIIKDNRENFELYFEGEKAIPMQTSGTELRRIYAASREFAHCVDGQDILQSDRVGLLLFYNGVKENFQLVFEKEMQAGQKSLKGLDAAIKTAKDKHLGITQDVGDWWNEREYLSDVIGDLEQVKKGAVGVDLTKLNKMDRKQLKETLSKLQPLVNHRALKRVPELKKAMAPLKRAYKIIDEYLYNLNPRCMDFLEWHEVVPGQKPEARCRF